ncbi:MAG: transcription termination factor Rho [Reinekea sp.]|jgi:transcription termination factor Rho
MWILRKPFAEKVYVAAIDFLMDRLKITKTNAEFFSSMKSGVSSITKPLLIWGFFMTNF